MGLKGFQSSFDDPKISVLMSFEINWQQTHSVEFLLSCLYERYACM